MAQLLRVYAVLSKDPNSGPQTTLHVTVAPEAQTLDSVDICTHYSAPYTKILVCVAGTSVSEPFPQPNMFLSKSTYVLFMKL